VIWHGQVGSHLASDSVLKLMHMGRLCAATIVANSSTDDNAEARLNANKDQRIHASQSRPYRCCSYQLWADAAAVGVLLPFLQTDEQATGCQWHILTVLSCNLVAVCMWPGILGTCGWCPVIPVTLYSLSCRAAHPASLTSMSRPSHAPTPLLAWHVWPPGCVALAAQQHAFAKPAPTYVQVKTGYLDWSPLSGMHMGQQGKQAWHHGLTT
jgi:hypothetical protein